MSHQTNTETGQRHPTARSTEVDDSSTAETRADELTWPFLSPAITDCPQCRHHRSATVAGETSTTPQWGSTDGGGSDAATTIESDTGTESVRLEPGTVAAPYAAVSPEADLLSVHVHADPAYTVRLRGPDGVVRRTISATGGSGDNVGVVTWTVEAPPQGQWTVEIRAPADASCERVSATFGTLAGEEAVVPSPDSSE